MDRKEAFKIGFLLRCAEEGLEPGAIEQRIEKAAAMRKDAIPGEQVAGDTIRAGGRIASKGLGTVLNSLKWLGALGPPVAGLTGGYALSQLGNDTHDLEELRKQEELEEYYRAIDSLSRRNPVAAN